MTAISTDTFTITRTQESSSARTVIVGDQIAAVITKKTLTDIENASGARAYNSASVTGIVTSTWTSVPWDTERYDTDAYHSTVSNTSRMTVPTSGIYLFTGSVQWDTNSSGARGLRLLVNGTTQLGAMFFNVGTGNPAMNISEAMQLAASDYVELQVYQTSGSNRSLINSADNSLGFSVTRIGL